MTSYVLKPLNKTKGTSRSSIEYLYPNDRDCLRVIVPTIQIKEQFLIKLFKNQKCQSIFLGLFITAVAKIVFGKSNIRQWFQVFFETFGIFLAQKKVLPTNQLWGSILNGILIFYSLFSISTLSAICYETLVSSKYTKQIDTINDLMQSNLTILVPSFMSEDFTAFGENLE